MALTDRDASIPAGVWASPGLRPFIPGRLLPPYLISHSSGLIRMDRKGFHPTKQNKQICPVADLIGSLPSAAVSVDHLLVLGGLRLVLPGAAHEAVGGLLVVLPRDVLLVLTGRRRVSLNMAQKASHMQTTGLPI